MVLVVMVGRESNDGVMVTVMTIVMLMVVMVVMIGGIHDGVGHDDVIIS